MRDQKQIAWLIVGAILLLLGAFLRFPGLDTNPPGFWQDEASTGVDAWLLWTTGRDRAGELLPLIARSFGDYPLAGYRYLTAPIVGLFGPTIGHERLVAAIFGTLMIAATAVVVTYRFGRGAALGAMIAGALCPTWLHFSRYGSEAILLPASLIIGWAAIAHGKKRERYVWLWIGFAVLAFSGYTYHAVKLFLPLWMAGFLVLQRSTIVHLWRSGQRKHVIGPAVVFSALVLPSVVLAFTSGGMARGRTVLAWHLNDSGAALRLMVNNYLTYFDPGMLFVRGGPAAAQAIVGLGMWNLVELPMMIVGFTVLFRRPDVRPFAWFLLFWFLLGPLPGGVTYETHNMGRAIAWLPVPQMISGIGTAACLAWAWRTARSTEANTLKRSKGAVVGALVIAAWGVTIGAVYWSTIVRYPKIAQRDFQFDVSHGLLCARKHRTTEKLIVSPGFQVGSVFAQFLYGDLDQADPSGRIWELGERTTVAAGELYVFPAHRPIPEVGREVCRVLHTPTGQPAAYVFAAPAGDPDKLGER